MDFDQQELQEPVQAQENNGQYDEFGDMNGGHGFVQEIQEQLPPVVNFVEMQGENMNAPDGNFYNQGQQEVQNEQGAPGNNQEMYQHDQQGAQHNPQNQWNNVQQNAFIQENQQGGQHNPQNQWTNAQQNAIPRQGHVRVGYGPAPALRHVPRFNPYVGNQANAGDGFNPEMTLDAALEAGWSGAGCQAAQQPRLPQQTDYTSRSM